MIAARHLTTLRKVVEALAPPETRVDRVLGQMATTIDGSSPGRRAEALQLLDLLALPMRLGVGTRRKILLAMADSPVAKLRTGFALLKRLTMSYAFSESDADGTGNPFWAALGYPGPRGDRPEATSFPQLPLSYGTDGGRVSADVVVVGSGAGGGIAAGGFARAGKRVIVIEAGKAFAPGQVQQLEQNMSEMYLDRGVAATDDLGVAILAGSALGGGTKINWCTSFRLEDDVAAEWEAESGIHGLGRELAPHYAAIERELEIAPSREQAVKDQVILDGAKALGVHAAAMPRNAQNCSGGCGYCGFGCAYDKKRSTDREYLPDVVANGGAIYVQAKALRVVTVGSRASGVEVEQRLPSGEVVRFTVDAKEFVVSSAGTLRTPGLLARSGVRNPVLGKRLFLHPVQSVVAFFDHPIEAWNGPMQSAYSNAWSRRTGNYGAKIETAPMHPGLMFVAIPYAGPESITEMLPKAKYATTLISLTRDRDPGSIDLDDEAQIHYRLSAFDEANLFEGLAGCFDIAFAAGANEVWTMHNRQIRISKDDWNAGRRAMLAEQLRAIGTDSNRGITFSAHQMGTAPMGSDPRTSVVDAAGRVWGYDNLLVCDGSVFPQASAVNPMLTIMAMARRIVAQHVPLVVEEAKPIEAPEAVPAGAPLAAQHLETLAAPQAYPTA